MKERGASCLCDAGNHASDRRTMAGGRNFRPYYYYYTGSPVCRDSLKLLTHSKNRAECSLAICFVLWARGVNAGVSSAGNWVQTRAYWCYIRDGRIGTVTACLPTPKKGGDSSHLTIYQTTWLHFQKTTTLNAGPLLCTVSTISIATFAFIYLTTVKIAQTTQCRIGE